MGWGTGHGIVITDLMKNCDNTFPAGETCRGLIPKMLEGSTKCERQDPVKRFHFHGLSASLVQVIWVERPSRHLQSQYSGTDSSCLGSGRRKSSRGQPAKIKIRSCSSKYEILILNKKKLLKNTGESFDKDEKLSRDVWSGSDNSTEIPDDDDDDYNDDDDDDYNHDDDDGDDFLTWTQQAGDNIL